MKNGMELIDRNSRFSLQNLHREQELVQMLYLLVVYYHWFTSSAFTEEWSKTTPIGAWSTGGALNTGRQQLEVQEHKLQAIAFGGMGKQRNRIIRWN